MSHRYDKSSEYEKFWQPKADKFYSSKYPACGLKRYDSHSLEDLEFQRKDIDLTITIEDRKIHISEKYRKDDYGDLLIELYSKYPTVHGWMYHSEADFITYFTPKKVYVIDKKKLTQWFEVLEIEEKLRSEILHFHSNNRRQSSRIKLNFKSPSGNNLSIYLIQAFNKIDNTEWHTMSLTVAWEDLVKEGLEIKQYLL